jgi:tRNA modification GTPase
MNASTDTIVAIATAPGAGGVGMLRVSGPQALRIATALGCPPLQPRHAHYARFRDAAGEVLDDGIALYFPNPRSFTGEDVVELQGHGSPVVLQQLVARCVALGARQARPGEFSERAFLNGKLDLAQAEAIADLIAASDTRAARAARRFARRGVLAPRGRRR